MSYENILFETEGHMAKVVINRQKAMNALNNATIIELIEVFSEIKEDKNIYGVIVTGAGDKAFVAGADIKELAVMTKDGAKELSEKGQGLLNLIENLGKPVVAAVNGFALGGGCEIAMACSFRYASENAKFGQPEINLGLIPGYGGTQRLPRLVGKGRAMELLLTGNIIGADDAFRMGLVNGVVPQDELLPKVEKVMKIIMAKSPIIGGFIAEAVNSGICMTLKNGLDLEAELFSKCAETEDMREGTKAFIEKRKPEFKGE